METVAGVIWSFLLLSRRRLRESLAPTCRVFDQHLQLLVHSHLKGPVVGVLCLVSSHAAVSLADKRVSDAGGVLTPHSGAIGHIVRQQHHDAVGERSRAFRNAQLLRNRHRTGAPRRRDPLPVLGEVGLQVVVVGQEEVSRLGALSHRVVALQQLVAVGLQELHALDASL